ncbi:unnamed protein product [Mycena citricolor]|uniref:Peptide N-acetyl-beta-D-glucosaminyl asparaginase amidase A N-terminal domain-containing protein n=1 Tax=Mycena citricolor TaxID=2018698 RepID=A0AAD2HU88_9AGAR|nr:unnamed protein product [Mycena citricolor]
MLRFLSSLSVLVAAISVLPRAAAVLVDFQVAVPPIVPAHAKQCTVEIFTHDFAQFGVAALADYTPPTDCGEPGTWAAISLNFTVTSNGTQFDRLGVFTFQNVEIWRTSTPEPTAAGIIWTYVKDVTKYTPLFAKPGLFIGQLDNIIETGLNGIYSSTMTATFYASSPAAPPAKQADLIIPLSTLLNTTGDAASVPPAFSIEVTLPQNTIEVYAELYPSGNGNEGYFSCDKIKLNLSSTCRVLGALRTIVEPDCDDAEARNKYTNVANRVSIVKLSWMHAQVIQFSSEVPGALGQGPFREVRLLIDGRVAGVAFPYPVVFTGGVSPTCWRPITSYGAVDLPSYFLDVTPFVPLLVDGKPHNFTIDVVSAEANHAILANWFVSGNLQVVTDASSAPTTGRMISYSASPFAATTSKATTRNGDVDISVAATRHLEIVSEIVSGSGVTTQVEWAQNLSFVNDQAYLNNFLVQNVFQVSSGIARSLHNGVPAVLDNFTFPFTLNFTSLNAAGTSFFAGFDHSYNRHLTPSPFLLSTTISERQMAGGAFTIASTGNFGSNGTSENTISYVDAAGNTFARQVNAASNVITLDHQSGTLSASSVAPAPLAQPGVVGGSDESFAAARLPAVLQARISGQ